MNFAGRRDHIVLSRGFDVKGSDDIGDLARRDPLLSNTAAHTQDHQRDVDVAVALSIRRTVARLDQDASPPD